jgi:hypothetical protein
LRLQGEATLGTMLFIEGIERLGEPLLDTVVLKSVCIEGGEGSSL